MQKEVKTAGSDTSGLNSSSDASPCESQRQLSKIEGSTNTKEAKNHLKGLGTAAKNHRTSCPETGWGTSWVGRGTSRRKVKLEGANCQEREANGQEMVVGEVERGDGKDRDVRQGSIGIKLLIQINEHIRYNMSSVFFQSKVLSKFFQVLITRYSHHFNTDFSSPWWLRRWT